MAVWLDYAGVSRRHAPILVNDHTASVEDLGSKNGTTVEGRTANGLAVLQDGDRITFGLVAVTYRQSSGVSTETR